MSGNACEKCNNWLNASGICDHCGDRTGITSDGRVLEKSKTMPIFTTMQPSVIGKFIEIGLVFGTSSKQAFWGISSQADRLTRASNAALANLKYEAALLEADAIVGVSFALNNSTGSSAVVAGSSEAVMYIGTAVRKLG